MIDFISSWASELVVSLIIVTIIEMILPNGKIKKYVKTVIGVYIIFCITSPFLNKNQFAEIYKNAQKNLEEIEIKSQVNSQLKTDSSIEALYIQEFEKNLIKKVEELGYKVKKCEIDLEINATKDNAGINAIYLSIDEQKEQENEKIKIEDVEKVEISINNKEEGNNITNEENSNIKKIKEELSNYYEISEEKIQITQN